MEKESTYKPELNILVLTDKEAKLDEPKLMIHEHYLKTEKKSNESNESASNINPRYISLSLGRGRGKKFILNS